MSIERIIQLANDIEDWWGDAGFDEHVEALREYARMKAFFKQHDPMGYQAYLARQVGENIND